MYNVEEHGTRAIQWNEVNQIIIDQINLRYISELSSVHFFLNINTFETFYITLTFCFAWKNCLITLVGSKPGRPTGSYCELNLDFSYEDALNFSGDALHPLAPTTLRTWPLFFRGVRIQLLILFFLLYIIFIFNTIW